MTAQITDLEADAPQPSAELRTASGMHAAGQLWERAADAGLNQDVIEPEQWQRIAVVRNHLGSRSGRRVPMITDAGSYGRGVASGMIIAGQVREHAHFDAARFYLHTGFECGAL